MEMDGGLVAVAHTWVFDVDGTVIDSLTGTSLRPSSAALLAHLRTGGCRTVLWSAGGAAYAGERAEQHRVAHLVDAYHDKEGRDGAGRYVVHGFLATLDGVVFVDDRPEDLPVGADVIAVSPYLAPDPHDRGLGPALLRAQLGT
jgi:hypothetical protein